MATRELSLQRQRRQRWLTVLIGLSLAVTAIAVGLTYWGGSTHQAPASRVPPSPAADVNQQLSGYTFTRSDQGHPVFTIHAARTVSYEQSKSTTLEDVMVEVYGRKGDRGDILRTARCEYNSQSGDFFGSGPVEVELGTHANDVPGAGLRGKHRIILNTSKVTYHQQQALAETQEPVNFKMGSVSGTAQGMEYGTRDGWLVLKHDVVVDLPQGTPKAPQPTIHLTADALRYDKEDGQIALTGPVEVIQAKRRALSDAATVTLDDKNRISKVNLDGNAKAFDITPLRNVELDASQVEGDFDQASGNLRHLTAQKQVVGQSRGKGSFSRLLADRVDMDLAGKHPKPLHGVAQGSVHIDLESQPVLNVPDKSPVAKGPEKKTLIANQVNFEFRPTGASLKSAETVGSGTIFISPADAKTGDRVITAGQFLMNFDTRSRIQNLQGTSPTKVLFHPAPGAPAGTPTQQSEAERLDADFDVNTNSLREVRQSGNFHYRDGDRQASADNAHYDTQTQMMLLLGHPQVWDKETRARAQRITMDTRTQTSIGEGNVQAVHLPTPPTGAPPAATPELPTNVLADKMVARQQSQTIHYEGHVRAWQGTDVVESTSLDVYKVQKRVSSGYHVITSYLQPATAVPAAGAPPHPPAAAEPVTVYGDYLEYFEKGRRARYRGDVRLVTQSTTLLSDGLDVYFSQGDSAQGSEVDHAVAAGHVKVTQPGRVGTGEHGEYFAGPGKIVLTGGPPLLVDDQKGSTTGQRLTFFTLDDRLFVDGGDKTPSISKHHVAP